MNQPKPLTGLPLYQCPKPGMILSSAAIFTFLALSKFKQNVNRCFNINNLFYEKSVLPKVFRLSNLFGKTVLNLLQTLYDLFNCVHKEIITYYVTRCNVFLISFKSSANGITAIGSLPSAAVIKIGTSPNSRSCWISSIVFTLA